MTRSPKIAKKKNKVVSFFYPVYGRTEPSAPWLYGSPSSLQRKRDRILMWQALWRRYVMYWGFHNQPISFFFEDDVIQSFFSFNRKHSSIIRHNRLCTLRIVTVSQMTDRLRSVISAIFHTYIRNTRKVPKKWCWVRMEKTTWTDRVKMKLSQWGEWTRPFQVLPREQASLRCKGFI